MAEILPIWRKTLYNQSTKFLYLCYAVSSMAFVGVKIIIFYNPFILKYMKKLSSKLFEL